MIMKPLFPVLAASLVLLHSSCTFAEEPLPEDAVAFTSEETVPQTAESSPFFANFNAREIPAGEFLDDGSAYQSISGFNFGFQSPSNDRIQGVHTNVNVTELQTLGSTGASAILFEGSNAIISGRALGGYAFGRDGLDDTWQTSYDLYAARPLGSSGSNFVKLGAVVDNQDYFGKRGPALGLLFAADSKHPITFDAAYGSGFGDPYPLGLSIYSVADDDLQLQAGIALSPTLQVGVTGQYVKWDGVFTEEKDWKTGGFIRYHSPKGFSVSLGAAGGEHGTTGFAHFTIRPRREAPLMIGSKSSVKGVLPAPGYSTGHSFARSWMVAPIQRQESLQIRQESIPEETPTEAPRGTLTCTYTDNAGSLANLLAGIPAIHRVVYTNTGTLDQVVTINSLQNFDGSFTSPGTTTTLASGQSLTAQGPEVPAGAPPFNQAVVITVNGQQFNLTCSFPAGSPNPTTLPPISIGP